MCTKNAVIGLIRLGAAHALSDYNNKGGGVTRGVITVYAAASASGLFITLGHNLG